ncbi:hypothetical protein SK128_024676, partial [Halocaridina rubra]
SHRLPRSSPPQMPYVAIGNETHRGGPAPHNFYQPYGRFKHCRGPMDFASSSNTCL